MSLTAFQPHPKQNKLYLYIPYIRFVFLFWMRLKRCQWHRTTRNPSFKSGWLMQKRFSVGRNNFGIWGTFRQQLVNDNQTYIYFLWYTDYRFHCAWAVVLPSWGERRGADFIDERHARATQNTHTHTHTHTHANTHTHSTARTSKLVFDVTDATGT